MPIPALSSSYKQRIHADKTNNESARTQSIEGAARTEEAKNSNLNTLDTMMRPPHSRTSSYQAEADGAKRRSLLPQPGQSRYSMHQPETATSKTDNNAQQSISGRLRPRSMYQTGMTQPPQSKAEDQTASRSIRPPSGISKTSELQSAGIGRSRSLRQPGASMQSAQSTLNTNHGRTQSTSNASGLRKEVSNAASSLARPRSLLAAPNSTLKSNASAETTSHSTRASTRLAGLSRTASVKTRSDTLNGGVAASSVSRPDDPRRREIPKEDTTKAARPAFSTLQQHFTPRKTGKAPTSTFLHPAPASGANALPSEIINIQSELLQLHLLHATSAKVGHQWQQSAKRSLHKKFEEVACLHQAMLEYERTGREEKNLQALLEWSTGISSLGLVEYIQILSGPLHELPSLLESGGRFERLADEFERWTLRVEHIWSARTSSMPSEGDLGSIEGLDDSWKAENAALIRKVTSFARDLEQVRQPSVGSSIASIVDTCRSLLEGLSDELQLMQATEIDVVSKEKEWIEVRLQAITRDVSSYSVDADKDTATWRL